MYALPYVIPNISIDVFWPTAVIAGLVFYIVNSVIKPILKILTLPINILTLGLFSLFINAFVFWLVGYFVNGFDVTTVVAAFVGGFVASVVAWIIGLVFDDE